MDKKTVIVLVIIALVLASISIAYGIFDSGNKAQTISYNNVNMKSNSEGKIGVDILPPVVEQKNG